MFTEENLLFLRRCFDLGRLGADTSPNPSVGSVIVSPHGRIIGEGYTQTYGGAHAEVMAVASVKMADRALLPLSTIYVSLEPCAHFGRTPPCLELILREKISHVIIAHLDPNPLVCGKSVTKLQEKGVDVKILNYNNVLIRRNTEGGAFLSDRQLENGKIVTLMPFFINMTRKRPYIILKWAESADGFIGALNRHVPISNNYSKRLVHKWRSEVDAIMVGTTTAEVDNPELTNRFYFGKSPIRVVLDRYSRLSPSLKVFDGTVKTFVFSENTEGGGKLKIKNSKLKPDSLEQSSELQTSNFKVEESLELQTSNVKRQTIAFDDFLLENILSELQANKIGILFVEGGLKLLSSFMERGLWDEARVFTASKTLGEGIRAPQLLNGTLQQTIQLEEDTLRIYRQL
jgi:diaminohydroxyphosphoribosylaminopyrimidine deaminase / 5-amino-6-(5-phosphoribosylamino)uracil reductase